ncbi:MAG TPA: hypothetical protein GXX29_08150, partial [Firmicutes bacterium]|nr:hypothetical protein [Bacillota bacterium]
MCKKFITMIIAACLCLVWATFSQAAEVAIVNGSYEEEPVDNIIPGWPAPFGAGVVG